MSPLFEQANEVILATMVCLALGVGALGGVVGIATIVWAAIAPVVGYRARHQPRGFSTSTDLSPA